MPQVNQPPLTVDQAIARAKRILETGVQLQESAQTQADARRQFGDRSSVAQAATELKENRLLSYRVSTMPEMMAPILETLMTAVSGASAKGI